MRRRASWSRAGICLWKAVHSNHSRSGEYKEGHLMANQIQCPKCGNYKTEPHMPGFFENESQGMDRVFKQLGFGKGDTFENPKYVQKFNSGEIRAKCNYCGLIFDNKTVVARPTVTNSSTSDSPVRQRTPTERLDELEQMKTKGLVTEEEYRRKREGILRDL